MCCWVLDYKTLVALNALKNLGLFDSPFADVRPLLGSLGIFLFRM